MERLIRTYCPRCADYSDCAYRLRGLERKCPQLDDVAEGYQLAEEQLALTAGDIALVIRLADEVRRERGSDEIDNDWLCEEVLRRYNQQRNANDNE